MFTHQFKTDFKRTPPEKNSGKSIVESAGYIPAQKRIENMILAGQRLVDSRKEQYDFDGEVDEDYTDPSRSPNFDMADASMMQNAIELTRQRKVVEKQSQPNQELPDKVLETNIDPE